MADADLVGTLTFAVGAGLATFFAPCAYPLLPGYVGYYLHREDAGLAGAAVRGVVASAGALVVLLVGGGVLLTVGQRLARHVALLEPLVGVALVAFGLLFLSGRAPSPHLRLPERRDSVAGFALFGGVYALAAAGCVVPVFFGVVTQSLTLPPAQAALALSGYAAGAALPLTGVTLLSAAGSDAVREWGRHVGTVQRLAGVVMVLAGVTQVVVSLRYLGWL